LPFDSAQSDIDLENLEKQVTLRPFDKFRAAQAKDDLQIDLIMKKNFSEIIRRPHSPDLSKIINKLGVPFVAVFATVLLFTPLSIHAEKGYIFIESSPDSGVVIIDGNISERYYTPVLCTLSVGEHTIEVTRNFYETQIFKVTIEPEAIERKRLELVRLEKFKLTKPKAMKFDGRYGQLTILTDPFGAEVIADGEKISKYTPITLYSVPVGEHKYSIVYHYLQYDTTIMITGNAPQTAVIDLKNLKGKELYSTMPHVKTKVVIVVPGCEYKLDDSGNLLIKGVDAKINIRTGDTSLTLTHKELAEFPANHSTELGVNEKRETRLPKTEYTYFFDPFLDARLQFETVTYASKRKYQSPDSIKPSTHYQTFPATLNSGNDINVRIYIEEDGQIVFRYW